MLTHACRVGTCACPLCQNSQLPPCTIYTHVHTCATYQHQQTIPVLPPTAHLVHWEWSEALQMQSLALRYCAPQLSAPSSFSSPADGCVRSKIRMDACYRSYLLTIGNTEASTGPETAGRSTSAQQKWFMIRAQSHIFGTVLAIWQMAWHGHTEKL